MTNKRAEKEREIAGSRMHYDDASFKIFIRQEEMLPTDHYHSMQHWHDEIELMEITDGSLYYNINAQEIPLQTGDIIFVNSKYMHASYLKKSKGCAFNVVLVHPSLYASLPFIYASYAKPLFEESKIDYILFRKGDGNHEKLKQLFHQMIQIEKEAEIGYQLSLIACSYELLQLLYTSIDLEVPHHEVKDEQDLILLNKMTDYIYKNYADKISLRDIADKAHVSISKCARLFHKYMAHSPIDFLNLYRLEVSSNLLRSTTQSISYISASCGFDQQSHFANMFKKEYGCTPSSYRKNPVDLFVH